MTILKIFKAKIHGKVMEVKQVHFGKNRQDIQYLVDNKAVISADGFWNIQPIILN